MADQNYCLCFDLISQFVAFLGDPFCRPGSSDTSMPVEYCLFSAPVLAALVALHFLAGEALFPTMVDLYLAPFWKKNK